MLIHKCIMCTLDWFVWLESEQSVKNKRPRRATPVTNAKIPDVQFPQKKSLAPSRDF